jgi:DNA-binding XRE family transcriptional regulator
MTSCKHHNKCAKLTCPRREQTAGFCKMHYPLVMAELGLPIGKVSSDRAIEHLLKVRATGLGLPRAATLSGLAKITLWRILSKRPPIHASTEAKILSIPLDLMAVASDGYRIPKLGAQRRIQALQALGYTTEQIGDAAGITKDTVIELSTGKQPGCKLGTARAIKDLYERWQCIPGTSRAAVSRARTKGWALPMAWDEDAIDDPNAVPHDCRRVGQQQSRQERLAEASELFSFGLNVSEAAQRMGLTRDTLTEYMKQVS